MPGALRAAYDRVAARHPRSILIDGRRELAAASPRKLLDDHVIQDTHHPTLLGQVALAEAVLRELARKKVVRMPRTAQRARSTRLFAPTHFGMDAERVGDDVRADERALSAGGRVSVRSGRASGEIAAVCRGGQADQERRGARASGHSGNRDRRTRGPGATAQETEPSGRPPGREDGKTQATVQRGEPGVRRHSETRSTCQSWSRTVAPRPRNCTTATK